MDPIPPGIYAAVLTPLHADLTCNFDVLARHSLDLLKRGCTGIALFGTTGEGPSFSVKERIMGLEKLVQVGCNPKKIILANGSASVPDTVELARAVLHHGCAGLLAAPPAFFKEVKEEGVISYYREIIRQTADSKLKLLLYHFPKYTGVPITLNIIEALRNEFPKIVVGIKDSDGNWPFAKAVIDTFPGFQLFVGNEQFIIDTVQHKGAGAICGVANLYPELIRSLYESGEKNTRHHQDTIEAILKILKCGSFIPLIKAIMEKREGNGWHRVRPPLLPLNEAELESALSKLEALKQIF